MRRVSEQAHVSSKWLVVMLHDNEHNDTLLADEWRTAQVEHEDTCEFLQLCLNADDDVALAACNLEGVKLPAIVLFKLVQQEPYNSWSDMSVWADEIKSNVCIKASDYDHHPPLSPLRAEALSSAAAPAEAAPALAPAMAPLSSAAAPGEPLRLCSKCEEPFPQSCGPFTLRCAARPL